MDNILLMIFPAAILILAAVGAKISFVGETAPDYLCLRQSKMIQAIACLGVIEHHLVQQITQYGNNSKGPVTIFNYIGFLFTALFFFFSGYGLLTSYYSKEDYLKGFLPKRLTAVLIPFWLVNLTGLILLKIFPEQVKLSPFSSTGQVLSTSQGGAFGVLKDILGLTLVNSNGWFIIEIVIFYLLFYALFSIIKNKNLALAFLCIAVLMIMTCSFFRGHDPQDARAHWFRGEWWYNSTASFIYGLLYARFRERIDGSVKKHYRVLLGIFAVLVIGMISLTIFVLKHMGYYHEYRATYIRDAAVTLLVQMTACLVWICFVLLLNMRITLGNRALAFVSRIQLELFLMHGYIAGTVFADVRMGDLKRSFAVFATSIAGAALVTAVADLTVRKITGLLLKEKKVNDTLEARAAEEQRAAGLKRIRKICSIGIVILFVAVIAISTAGRWYLERECEKELGIIAGADKGDVVRFGRFDTDQAIPGWERLEWIVVKREGDRICLLTKKGIAGSFYNRRHEDVTWQECDLHELLGNDTYSRMFSEAEAGHIIYDGNDMLTLLTPEQAQELFDSDDERELDITRAAEKNGTNINRLSKANQWDMKDYRSSWWWLKGSSTAPASTAPIVTVDGEIVQGSKEVNRPGGAIRPVVWIKVN